PGRRVHAAAPLLDQLADGVVLLLLLLMCDAASKQRRPGLERRLRGARPTGRGGLRRRLTAGGVQRVARFLGISFVKQGNRAVNDGGQTAEPVRDLGTFGGPRATPLHNGASIRPEHDVRGADSEAPGLRAPSKRDEPIEAAL